MSNKQLQNRHGKSQVSADGKVTKLSGDRIFTKGSMEHFTKQGMDTEVVIVVDSKSKTYTAANIYPETNGEDLSPTNGKLGKGYDPDKYRTAMKGDPAEWKPTKSGYTEMTKNPEFLKRISAVIDIKPNTPAKKEESKSEAKA